MHQLKAVMTVIRKNTGSEDIEFKGPFHKEEAVGQVITFAVIIFIMRQWIG